MSVVPREPLEWVLDPVSGEQIQATDTPRIVELLDALRESKRILDQAIHQCEEAITAEMDRVGRHTLRYGRLEAQGASPQAAFTYGYDCQALREGLADAGLPEERINEIVETKVEEKVNRRELAQVRKTPAYAEVIDRCETPKPKRRGVDVRVVGE